jgi:hypothetical protein
MDHALDQVEAWLDGRVAALCQHNGIDELWTADPVGRFPDLATRNRLVEAPEPF